MKKQTLLLFFCLASLLAAGQKKATTDKTRLDFAKTYFELGGNYFPSFTGKRLLGGAVTDVEHPATLNTNLYWGGLHFWGHAEFFVSFPLHQLLLKENDQTSFELTHATVTGARFLPWAYQEKKLRPYVGVSWSALDFKQNIKPEDQQPLLQKNFSWVVDAGLLFGFESFAARLGVNYYPDHRWDYPISTTNFQKIETPAFSAQLSLIYMMEQSKGKDTEVNDRRNSFPAFSSPGFNANSTGDFFIGIGPSISFSLSESSYNNSELPFLNKKQSSNSYFDIALGYQFNKADIFTALSFRNPTFENQAYGIKQAIQKTSLCLEVNKFLTDYSGFAPYVGINIAYDHIKYHETGEGRGQSLNFQQIEPGISFGWDIIPGKAEELLILRTNLRWYPFSSFEVDGKKFNFNQLEYNLIQVVFYPGRWMRTKAGQ